MAKQNEVAQNVMDLFYQKDQSTEDFFEPYHFKYLVGVAYAFLAQQEFEKSKRTNQQEVGMPIAQLNPEWFIQETVKVENSESGYFAKLENKPFSFNYDSQSSGIMNIVATTGNCTEFMRMKPAEMFKLKLLPVNTVVWWYILADKIYFSNCRCGLSEINVWYMPALSEKTNAEIPEALVQPIIQQVWTMFVNARNGTVVDMSNNQNPNKTLETEIADLIKRYQNP